MEKQSELNTQELGTLSNEFFQYFDAPILLDIAAKMHQVEPIHFIHVDDSSFLKEPKNYQKLLDIFSGNTMENIYEKIEELLDIDCISQNLRHSAPFILELAKVDLSPDYHEPCEELKTNYHNLDDLLYFFADDSLKNDANFDLSLKNTISQNYNCACLSLLRNQRKLVQKEQSLIELVKKAGEKENTVVEQ